MYHLQDALLHWDARRREPGHINESSPPWEIAPPFTSRRRGQFTDEVAQQVARWTQESRDVIKALPRRKVLPWGEPQRMINQPSSTRAVSYWAMWNAEWVKRRWSSAAMMTTVDPVMCSCSGTRVPAIR